MGEFRSLLKTKENDRVGSVQKPVVSKPRSAILANVIHEENDSDIAESIPESSKLPESRELKVVESESENEIVISEHEEERIIMPV